MCDASGETLCHVASRCLETFARTRKGRSASAPALRARSRNATRCQTAQGSCPVGGGVSQILARLARSTRRIFGKGEPTVAKTQNEVNGNRYVSRMHR